MKILKVTGVNVKGRSFAHDLSPVTVIVGANAAGKTAVMKAIDIALTQKIAPASYPAIAPLFEGFPSMGCSLDTDLGLFQRTFADKGGKVSMVTDVRPDVVIPPVALDADIYFGLSIEKRTTFVASMVKLPDTFSEQGVIAELKNKLVLPDKRNTETTQAIVSGILEAVGSAHAPNVQEWLADQIVNATARVKSARDTKQRMEKSAQASVQIQSADENQVRPDQIPQFEASLERIGKEIATASEALGKVRAAKDAEVGAREKRKARRKELNEQLATLVDQSEVLLALQQELLVKQTEVNEYVSKTSELTNQKQALVTEGTGLKMLEETKVQNDINAQQRELNEGIKNLAEMNGRVAVLQNQIATIEAEPHCPTCKAASDGWRDEVKKVWQEEIDKISGLIAATEIIIPRLEKFIGELKLKLAEVTNLPELNTLREKIKTLEEPLRLSQAEDTRIRELSKSLPGIQEQIRVANEKHQQRRDAQTKLEELGDPALDEQAPSRDYSAELGALTNAITNLQLDQGKVQSSLKLATAAAANAARKAQEDAERVKAVDDYDLQVIALDVLKEFQAKMVEAAFITLLADANLIADAVLKSPLAYRDGEIGRYDEQKRWISHRCFSGTEQAATYAAMSFALATTSACRIVRVDELGRLDRDNKAKFVNRMVELVKAGKIDQSILVDTSAEPYVGLDGVHIVQI